MRIDAHQHFWRLSNPWTNWPTPDLAPIYRDFGADDLEPHLAAANIDRTILVQAAPDPDETRNMLSVAASRPFVAGVVGWVDFEDPAQARADLDAFGQSPLFVGVRPMLQAIEDPAWILGEKQREVLAEIVRRGLTFDALIQPRHLDAVATLAELLPGLPIIIDHGAKPDIRERAFDGWATGMTSLARYGNVRVKLSGLLTEAERGDGLAELRPYVGLLRDAFGADRMMWGSDWPVINLVADYQHWADLSEQLLDGLDDKERSSVWGRTAIEAYGLADKLS